MLLCCSVWPCVLRPCLPCTPAWLLTHSIFILLLRGCIYSRMEVPRNYLPINTLTPLGTVPGVMNGSWCINNLAPSPSVETTLRHVFDIGPQSSSADVCPSCQNGNVYDDADAGSVSFLSSPDSSLYSLPRVVWTQLCNWLFHLHHCVRTCFCVNSNTDRHRQVNSS